jgi:hypothetical protein
VNGAAHSDDAGQVRVPHPLRLVWDAWRAITWRTAGWTLLAGTVLWVIYVTTHQGFFIFLYEAQNGKFGSVFKNFSLMQLFSFIFLLCVLPADLAVVRGAPRVRSYLVAVVTAGLLCAVIDWTIKGTLDAAGTAEFRWWWKPVDALWIFLTVLFLGGPSTFVYADWQRARRSAARLHAAGLARTQAARDILQRRLQALQARIEPQFLFDTLAHIGEIYKRDSEKGQQTLDSLIAYLRAAMPQMGGSTSTVDREVDLVRAYVAIVAARSDGRVRLTVGGDTGESIAFPPMLLLPLVDHAIASSRLARVEDGAIALHAVKSGDYVQVTIGHGGNAFSSTSDAEAVRRVRDRLHTLYEDAAKFELRTRADHGTEIVMEIPA